MKLGMGMGSNVPSDGSNKTHSICSEYDLGEDALFVYVGLPKKTLVYKRDLKELVPSEE